MTGPHLFKAGDRVVYTNSFGVCWGVKTLTSQEPPYTEGHEPRYHYEGSDTPWYSVGQSSFKPADAEDLEWAKDGLRHDDRFQQKHGFTPTIEQLGGCY